MFVLAAAAYQVWDFAAHSFGHGSRPWWGDLLRAISFFGLMPAYVTCIAMTLVGARMCWVARERWGWLRLVPGFLVLGASVFLAVAYL